MQTTSSFDITPIDPVVVTQQASNPRAITTVDGKQVDLAELSIGELEQLQWEQEPLYARAILESPKRSSERAETTARAYGTICAILDELNQRADPSAEFSMGMDHRYADLILRLLEEQNCAARFGGLFEVGYSAGVLLKEVASHGYQVGGLEVVDDLRQQAMTRVDAEHHERLLVGDFLSVDLSDHLGKYSIVYWNDVLEHIAPDEIREYLQTIKSLLCPGGMLVTITPNWHMRPSDVTAGFMPPRSEAIGFHLKEYTIGEIAELTKSVGFESLRVPAFVSKGKIYDSKRLSLTQTKIMAESFLEYLPYKVAVQACRRFGLNCSIAQLPLTMNR